MHQFVLADHNLCYPTGLEETIRFGPDGINAQDSLTSLNGTRQLINATTTLHSYGYHSTRIGCSEQHTIIKQGICGNSAGSTLEEYRAGAAFDTGQDLQRVATLRQQASEVRAKQFSGTGTSRAIDMGTIVTIENHPGLDRTSRADCQFLITALSYQVRNNLPDDIAAAWHDPDHESGTPISAPVCRVRFEAIRKHIPFIPAVNDEHRQPGVKACLTATVVGPSDEEIYTDEYGRIKIQFHFVRSEEHPANGAGYNEKSFPWVRVANNQAGAGFGSQFIPRVGQEVVVGFIDGDINNPVVTGTVHNGTHANPHFSGAGSLPANKALSGIKTQGVKDHQNYNELLFDDTAGQSRTKLSSESGTSQLNLGCLVHPRTNGHGEARGQGFELRTDQFGALRAANGILITANAQANVTGKQLDRHEALQQLVAAEQTAQSLESEPKPENDPQHKLKAAIESWDSSTSADLAKPNGAIVLCAPAGIAAVTPNSITIATGTNLDQVAAHDTNQTSARRWVHHVGESISHFVQGVKGKASMNLIARSGHIEVQARDGKFEATASNNITVTATTGKVTITAVRELLLTCGGAYIRLANGNIDIHAPGTVSIKGERKILSGPAGMTPDHPSFPNAKLEQRVQFDLGSNARQGGTGVANYVNEPYKLYADGSLIKQDFTNERGQISIEHYVATTKYAGELAHGLKFMLPTFAHREGEEADLQEDARGQQGLRQYRFDDSQKRVSFIAPNSFDKVSIAESSSVAGPVSRLKKAQDDAMNAPALQPGARGAPSHCSEAIAKTCPLCPATAKK